MDSENDYNIGKAIVRGISGGEWDVLRLGKGAWPADKEAWKEFRNYSMEELKEALKDYKKQALTSQITPRLLSPYDGLQDISTALPRSELVADLYTKICENRFVHLGAPAASGKTSLLQLLEQHCTEKGMTCFYVSMLTKDFQADLKNKTGIDVNTWQLQPNVNGECPCADASRQYVVMFDDAQRQYADEDLWTSLIKPSVTSRLPRNISFIISATYSLVTAQSPVSFRDLSKLGAGDFHLNDGEVMEFIRLSSVKNKFFAVGRLLVDPVIQNVLAANCNGHIGALAVSIGVIMEKFKRAESVTVEAVASFYLSPDTVERFERCFSSGVASVPKDVQDCLLEILTYGRTSVSQGLYLSALEQLVRSGVLTKSEGQSLEFSSPAASRFIHNIIFPHRSTTRLETVQRDGIFDLMKTVLRRMSGTTLRQSVVKSTDVPSEATFQHLMLPALEAVTPPSCSILPELSKFFPLGVSADREMDVEGGPKRVRSEAIKGRLDYFLNGSLRWAIEVLIMGDGLGEHLGRLESGGKYEGLGYNDYAVVDFRVTATGEVTNVRRHKHRMTVFLKHGDFRSCQVLCGLDGPAETIPLAN